MGHLPQVPIFVNHQINLTNRSLQAMADLKASSDHLLLGLFFINRQHQCRLAALVAYVAPYPPLSHFATALRSLAKTIIKLPRNQRIAHSHLPQHVWVSKYSSRLNQVVLTVNLFCHYCATLLTCFRRVNDS